MGHQRLACLCIGLLLHRGVAKGNIKREAPGENSLFGTSMRSRGLMISLLWEFPVRSAGVQGPEAIVATSDRRAIE